MNAVPKVAATMKPWQVIQIFIWMMEFLYD